MKSAFKSLLCIAFAVSAFVSMTACGGGNAGQGTAVGTETTTDEVKNIASSGVIAGFPIETESGKSYDTIPLGRMAEGEIIEGTFEVVNNSPDKPLVIIQIVTGCGCTAVDFSFEPIPAGESRSVTYRFDSKGRLGQQLKSIEVISAERQVASVYLKGEVY